ncbi:hypothetical protein B0T22DRAFT_440039 [Podospora appendiculata]|uniref:SigF-like NTF2-like domain-containing protein n=1 Tax=Podospora appendiculata TaxID=314037 RepID=A0AAE1CCG8_9PEZI|nr:hypothetical protein B0T22DRAFT_440039 [Podospora appendiculata]
MEHPVKDIRGVVRALCQGTPEEQQEAVAKYFVPSAEFVHPFCRVPPFEGVRVPLVGEVNSRMLVLAIFKWYKILSPKIELEIESTVFDQRASLLYLTIAQTFSIWFLPFHKAPVRLVSVLHLEQQRQQSTNGTHTPLPNGHHDDDDDNNDEPSYAEVVAGAVPEKSETTTTTTSRPNGGGHAHAPRCYMIKKQEDLYQVNEFLKFVFSAPAGTVYAFWQLFSTVFCVLGALLLSPLMRLITRRPAGSRG